MVKFRNIPFCFILFCFLAGHMTFASAKNNAYRNFWHPTFNGERLDYCTLDGKECGKTVANRYCKILGYDYSSQNVKAYNVGLTNYLSTNAQCKGWRCNGFMTIGCAMSLSHTPPKAYHYREKRFARPRFNDYRVDWCYDQGKGCGAKAAHSFCSQLGFMRAKRFTRESNVSATKTIGSEELCFAKNCNGFESIVCYR